MATMCCGMEEGGRGKTIGAVKFLREVAALQGPTCSELLPRVLQVTDSARCERRPAPAHVRAMVKHKYDRQ